jgi:hypothetical protein
LQLTPFLVFHNSNLSMRRARLPSSVNSSESSCPKSEQNEDSYSPFEWVLSIPIGFTFGAAGIVLVMFGEQLIFKLAFGFIFIIVGWLAVALQDTWTPPVLSWVSAETASVSSGASCGSAPRYGSTEDVRGVPVVIAEL